MKKLLFFLWLAIVVTGCSNVPDTQLDEQVKYHLLRSMKLVKWEVADKEVSGNNYIYNLRVIVKEESGGEQAYLMSLAYKKVGDQFVFNSTTEFKKIK